MMSRASLAVIAFADTGDRDTGDDRSCDPFGGVALPLLGWQSGRTGAPLLPGFIPV